MRSSDDYTSQLRALLPPGKAWPRDDDSTLGKLLAGLADEFARIDDRASRLLDEVDPLSTLELLPDWERLAALPDPCAPIADNPRERQIAISSKVAGLGGQSPAFFVELAARSGLEAVVDEFEPFTCVSYCDDPANDDSWRHVFQVRVLDSLAGDGAVPGQAAYFSAISGCDEPLTSWGSSSLECLVGQAKPAQATSLISYDLEPEPTLWFDFLAR